MKANHIIVLLVLQTIGFFALIVGLVFYVYQQQVPVAQPVAVDESDASVEEWIAVERMDYLLGPWASVAPEGVLVSVTQGTAGGDLTAGPWRLAIELLDHSFIVCGVYSHLQSAEAPELPWRLAHCQGIGEDPDAVMPLRVGFYRVPRWPYVHFKLGELLELDLAQVE